MLAREPLHTCRQPQLVEVRDLARDHAERERDGAALPEAVDTEARQLGLRVGDVEVARLLEHLAPTRRDHGHGVQDGFEIRLGQRWMLDDLLEVAVHAHDGRLAELQVDIGGAHVDGAPQQRVEFHGPSIGSAGRRLEIRIPTRGPARAIARSGGRARPRASFG